MNGGPKNSIISADIDIKNKVLKDKRRALIRVLKDKRPTLNGFENSLGNDKQQFVQRQPATSVAAALGEKEKGVVLRESMSRRGSKLFSQLNTTTPASVNSLEKVKNERDSKKLQNKQSEIYQTTDYFETREKAAQYPRHDKMYA